VASLTRFCLFSPTYEIDGNINLSSVKHPSIMSHTQEWENSFPLIPDTMDSITDELPEMDWSKINLPEKKPLRFQCGELSTLDHWKLTIASRLLKKSVASMIQTAVYTYLSRNWEEHENRLIVEANRLGITPEEMFVRLTEEDS